MRSMLEHGVNGIVDGGDLTHWSKPLPRDVETANRVDDLRVAAGVWAVGNSGNHCAGGGSDLSAMGVMHRPALGILAVYPDPTRVDGIGPFPGLYEIHTSESNPSLPDGLALHFVSHYGLAKDLAAAGVNIDPTPLPDHVNVFFSHGVFQSDERLYQCIDPHGEERAIPPEWATRGWDAMLLSHYHSLGPVPGFDKGERGQVWYTGSSLRRGFSDEPGQRGWLRVEVHPDGVVNIEAVPIWQRPQHDLPAIDATDMTATDLEDAVRAHLHAVTLTDNRSRELTGHGGAILRQRITGTSVQQRQALASASGRFARLTLDAAWWRLDTQAAPTGAAAPDAAAARAITARITDFAAEVTTRGPRLADTVGVPTALREGVLTTATQWAGQAAITVDTVEHDSESVRALPVAAAP